MIFLIRLLSLLLLWLGLCPFFFLLLFFGLLLESFLNVANALFSGNVPDVVSSFLSASLWLAFAAKFVFNALVDASIDKEFVSQGEEAYQGQVVKHSAQISAVDFA